MQKRTLLWIALLPAVLLLVPLIAMQFTDEVAWGVGDFVVAWVLLASVGFAYNWVTQRLHGPWYRAAVALALGTALLLLWVNLAVGIIGSEDNPANLLYLAVFAVGGLGAVLARLRPVGLARTALAMAVTQAMVPLVAFAIWRPPFTVGVLAVMGFSSVFAVLFALAAYLFRKAADARTESFAAAPAPGA